MYATQTLFHDPDVLHSSLAHYIRATTVQAKHIDEHEKFECRRADAPCGNRCGQYLPLGDMKRHYAESCAHRFVPCGLGCGYRVRAKVHLQLV